MQLVLKEYIVDDHTNFQETIKGPWIFERVDNAGIIWIVDNVLDLQGPISNVTLDTSVKFIRSVYRFGYVEAYVKLLDITRTRCKLEVHLYQKHRHYGEKPVLVATGEITFAFILKKSKKPCGLSKEKVVSITNAFLE